MAKVQVKSIMIMLRKISPLILIGLTWFNFALSASAQTNTDIVRKVQTLEIAQISSIQMIAGLSDDIPTKILDAVKKELSQRLNIKPDQLELEEAMRQNWSNGCLGLAKPDEICTQAIVEGWKVVMSYQNKTWTYRTDATGANIRLETK